jgi:hypothetical protein
MNLFLKKKSRCGFNFNFIEILAKENIVPYGSAASTDETNIMLMILSKVYKYKYNNQDN